MRTASRAVPLGDSGLSITVSRAATTYAYATLTIDQDAHITITDREAIALRDALIERYPLPVEISDDAERRCGHVWTTRAHGYDLHHMCAKKVATSDCKTYGHHCTCFARTRPTF